MEALNSVWVTPPDKMPVVPLTIDTDPIWWGRLVFMTVVAEPKIVELIVMMGGEATSGTVVSTAAEVAGTAELMTVSLAAVVKTPVSKTDPTLDGVAIDPEEDSAALEATLEVC